jgi:hypothetical protein
MAGKTLVLLGAGAAGAFLLAVGALTNAAPPPPARFAEVTDATAVQPAVAAANMDGWVVQTAPRPGRPAGNSSGVDPGPAGLWSTPAEFAPPD